MSKGLLLFGGTFNPVHNGHIAVSLHLMEQYNSSLVIIPNGNPPHRDEPKVDRALRMQMLNLAYGQIKDVSISDIELLREGSSYFYDTLKYFTDKSNNIRVLIGSDQANRFRTWFNWEKLLEMARFTVMVRGEPLVEVLPFEKVEIPQMDISSTKIRKMLAAGISIRGLVPRSIEQFMEENHLYRS